MRIKTEKYISLEGVSDVKGIFTIKNLGVRVAYIKKGLIFRRIKPRTTSVVKNRSKAKVFIKAKGTVLEINGG